MQTEKNFVASSERLATTPVNTLQEISEILKLKGATRVQFHFRRWRVTCCCKKDGYSYGSSKPTLAEALTDLLERVERGYTPIT